jgi:acyl-ACP thioesterase
MEKIIKFAEPLGVYKTTCSIPNMDVDFMKRLRPGALFGYFQDIASLHSENIGTGVERLANDFGVAWVLMRMRVDILRTPMLYEDITLSTWPMEGCRIIYDRDFTLAAANGDIIVRGSSAWILMDLEKREIAKEKLFDYLKADFPTERALAEKLGRVRMPSSGERIFDRAVTYSDTDYNGHMNNTRYIDVMMDGIGMDILRKYEPASIEVNYSREIRPGRALTLYKDDSLFETKGAIYADIRGDENESLFTGKIILRNVV